MVADSNTAELAEELRQFQAEKEKIRQLVGQIGGKVSNRREKIITAIFAVILVMFFAADIVRYVFRVSIPLPPLFSLEIGVLLVSLKIIWMIHNQTRVEHFQFWILNSIEYRINDMSKCIRQIETRLGEKSGDE